MDRFRNRESHGGFAPRARTNEQADVEFVSNDRRRAEYRLGARRKTAEPLRDELTPARGQPKLRHRAPLPSRSIVPDRSLFDQRTEHLRDEQRVSFRVAIEKGEKLSADLLPMECRLQPLLHVLARQAREHDLACDLMTAEHLSMRRRVVGRVGLMRQTDEETISVDLRQEMFERVPRRAVGELHLVEHDDERTFGSERANVFRELAEEPVLTSSGGDAVAWSSKPRLEVMQLVPLALRRARKTMRRP